MAETTNIEWTNATFNPWWGCTKVSPGCAHCYAERDSKRYGFKLWGPDSERRFFSDAHWNEPLKWNRKAQASGQPFRVFCASMADVFEDRRDLDAPRARLFDLIERTPFLTWLLLTKRPENMIRLGPDRWNVWPTNVWALMTAEDQAHFDMRIKSFMSVPAGILGISYEPAKSRIDFRGYLGGAKGGIDWLICGGESGPGADPMHVSWARSARDQAVASGCAFFFKQWGEYNSYGQRVGKKVAGKLLDGREWREFPE